MAKKKILDIPEWMSDEAKAHYEWLFPKITKENDVEEIDYPLIWAACDYYGRFLTSEKVADKKNYLSAYSNLLEKFKRKLVVMESKEEGSEEGREDVISKAFE